MSDPRFPQGPAWRFAVLDRSTFATITILDRIAFSRGVELRLNAPAQATGSVPSDDPEVNLSHTDGDPFVEEGTRILYGFRREDTDTPWVPRFAGTILQIEDTDDGDRAVSNYTALDAWQGLYQRPCRNGDGDLPGPTGLTFTATSWEIVIAELLANTISADGPCMIDAGEDYGGTSFYSGTLEDIGSAFNYAITQGKSVAEAWDEITSMGEADIVLTPIYDPLNRPGYTHELNVYARAGQNRPDAIFRHGDNCRLQRLVDGTQRVNEAFVYYGASRTLLSSSPLIFSGSVTKYGPQIAQLFYPGQDELFPAANEAIFQLGLRADGRTTIKVTPMPERAPLPFSDYTLGDRVPVWADRTFRKPIVGNDTFHYLRVYGIPITIGDDALETVTELLGLSGV